MTVVAEDRAAWLEQRRAAIGGSDAPAVVGLDPWASPIDVFLSKLGLDEEREPSAAMEWGNRLEGAVADHFADDTGLTVVDPGLFTIVRSDLHPFMACTPDRVLPHDDAILQIKTTGERMADRWENGPPDYVIVQLQHEIAVTDSAVGWIAVLIGGRDYRSYRFDRDDELIAMLVDLEGTFWNDHVETQIPPPPDGSPAAAEALARLYPQSVPGASVDLDQEAVVALDKLAALKIVAKQVEDDEKRYKAIVQAELGEAEEGLVEGRVACTWRSFTSSRVDTTSLRESRPMVAAEFTTVTKGRRFLVKGEK